MRPFAFGTKLLRQSVAAEVSDLYGLTQKRKANHGQVHEVNRDRRTDAAGQY